METVKTPNHVLTEDVTFYKRASSTMDSTVIPKGTFVKPIDFLYVPKHIKEDERFRDFRSATQVFIWCSYGFLVVLKSIVIEV